MQRRTILWLVVAAALFGSAASFALKEQCNHVGWGDGAPQYWRYCYSDILPVSLNYGLIEEPERVPYVDQFWEYPVVTGGFAYFAAVLTTGLVPYLWVTWVLLLACGGAVTWMLWSQGVDWRRICLWAAGPAIIIHGTVNWDLLAVGLAMAGWWAWTKDKALLSAFLFGLGGAAKVYPAFFLPFLLFAMVLRKDAGSLRPWRWPKPDWKGVTDVSVGAVLGLVLPNLIVWRLNAENWHAIWRFHGDRQPDWETPYEVLREMLRGADSEAWSHLVGTGGMAVLAVLGLGLAVAMWRRGLDTLLAGGIATLLFLLLNRVYSPQYTLWALPILLILRAPWPPVALYVAADLAVFLLRYPILATQGEADPTRHDAFALLHGLAVLARWTFLAMCVWAIAKREGLLSRKPEAEAAPTAADA